MDNIVLRTLVGRGAHTAVRRRQIHPTLVGESVQFGGRKRAREENWGMGGGEGAEDQFPKRGPETGCCQRVGWWVQVLKRRGIRKARVSDGAWGRPVGELFTAVPWL